ncbi:hypothetical protein L211DRAFT_847063 [Terfezia boudieri ATCC MYA-4762]|uniref:Uncharacterized protein n=1 Tax=Terfezia boudieri ATCC MYA-4762 TaxID=1051890 RepID=A0A3N4LU22_9PEZI|nr:hypothetical protein L211DRAFT_847063 [Terfezia boudieri ATCC MYA-4762]
MLHLNQRPQVTTCSHILLHYTPPQPTPASHNLQSHSPPLCSTSTNGRSKSQLAVTFSPVMLHLNQRPYHNLQSHSPPLCSTSTSTNARKSQLAVTFSSVRLHLNQRPQVTTCSHILLHYAPPQPTAASHNLQSHSPPLCSTSTNGRKSQLAVTFSSIMLHLNQRPQVTTCSHILLRYAPPQPTAASHNLQSHSPPLFSTSTNGRSKSQLAVTFSFVILHSLLTSTNGRKSQLAVTFSSVMLHLNQRPQVTTCSHILLHYSPPQPMAVSHNLQSRSPSVCSTSTNGRKSQLAVTFSSIILHSILTNISPFPPEYLQALTGILHLNNRLRRHNLQSHSPSLCSTSTNGRKSQLAVTFSSVMLHLNQRPQVTTCSHILLRYAPPQPTAASHNLQSHSPPLCSTSTNGRKSQLAVTFSFVMLHLNQRKSQLAVTFSLVMLHLNQHNLQSHSPPLFSTQYSP